MADEGKSKEEEDHSLHLVFSKLKVNPIWDASKLEENAATLLVEDLFKSKPARSCSKMPRGSVRQRSVSGQTLRCTRHCSGQRMQPYTKGPLAPPTIPSTSDTSSRTPNDGDMSLTAHRLSEGDAVTQSTQRQSVLCVHNHTKDKVAILRAAQFTVLKKSNKDPNNASATRLKPNTNTSPNNSMTSQPNGVSALPSNQPVSSLSLADLSASLPSVVSDSASSSRSILHTCSEQARCDDWSVEELACYFEDFVNIPKKMSAMAEMMYT